MNFKWCARIQWPFLWLCSELCSSHLLQHPGFSQPQGHSLDENDISKELISGKNISKTIEKINYEKISFWLFKTLNSKGPINNELTRKCYNFWWWEIMGNLWILFLITLGKNNLKEWFWIFSFLKKISKIYEFIIERMFLNIITFTSPLEKKLVFF